jgi:membrane fusion protein
VSATDRALTRTEERSGGALQPLFRQEVMVEAQSQWLGTVLLEPRVTHRIFATLSVLAVLAVASLLVFTSYTRKARVNGWLVPQQGVMRVFAREAGVVTHVHAREGMAVRKGMPLLVVSTETHSEALGDTRQEIVRRLTRRRNSMEDEKTTQDRLFKQQAADLAMRLDALRAEQDHLAQEMAIQHSRLQLSEKVVSRTRVMRARDIVPEPRMEDAERERLEQAGKLRNLERVQASLRREEVQVTAALNELPLRRRTQMAEIERNVAALEQELAEAELEREAVITAPADGTVTALQVEAGGSAQPSVPLMSILPAGSELQAHLFTPSHAIGFLKPGQRVLLRYAAFPYQKFGSYEGRIANVSQSAMSPSEMPQQLSGLTALFGPNEPIYRVIVDLASQTATAYGQPVPLQPGMQLEADVLIESRRLFEWVLEPLFSLTGKWSQ